MEEVKYQLLRPYQKVVVSYYDADPDNEFESELVVNKIKFGEMPEKPAKHFGIEYLTEVEDWLEEIFYEVEQAWNAIPDNIDDVLNKIKKERSTEVFFYDANVGLVKVTSSVILSNDGKQHFDEDNILTGGFAIGIVLYVGTAIELKSMSGGSEVDIPKTYNMCYNRMKKQFDDYISDAFGTEVE